MQRGRARLSLGDAFLSGPRQASDLVEPEPLFVAARGAGNRARKVIGLAITSGQRTLQELAQETECSNAEPFCPSAEILEISASLIR